MSLKYLQITHPATIVVDPCLRDWTDYDEQRHLDYHVAIFSCMAGKFDVVVDAKHTPYAAVLHMPFFMRLATILRGAFKGRLRVCTLVNAPRCVYAAHATLSALGLIGTDTAGKIIFKTELH